MNIIAVVSERIVIRHKFLITVIAVGLGITLPRIFHMFGIGPIFLPMFVPMVVIGSMLNIPFLLATAIATPFLSTFLFGMPELTATSVIVVQLTIVGTMQWMLKQTKLPVWTIAPASILIERILMIVMALLIPELGISSGAVFASYPGVIFLSIIGIIAAKHYES